jgi:tRNA pseudouridine65 synthase
MTNVKLMPKTGRLHQLRIHLNKIYHPLIGDPKYGDRFHNRLFMDEFNCNKLFLHAKTLEFIHPFMEEKIVLHSDFPKDWLKVFKLFGWKS